MKKILLTVLMFCAGNLAYAADGYVYVNDMSQLQYQLTPDGKVYFRNFNQLDFRISELNFSKKP